MKQLSFITLAAIGLFFAPQVSNAQNEDATLKEFGEWVSTWVANPDHDILLPVNWFYYHFEFSTAKQLEAEYNELRSNLAGISQTVIAESAKGKTNLIISKHSAVFDPAATGMQNAAIQQMTVKVPLFSLRMVVPGDKRGFSLLSFVKVDNTFRFAGKMNALFSGEKDLVTQILSNAAIGDFEKVLQEKGLLQGSAWRHLQKVGLLR